MTRESFLDRWSRRKREGEPDDVAPEAEETPPAKVEDERPDEEILAELGLPNPEDLQPGDDVRGFMQAAVPDRIRRLALRRLWRSNPVLANVDGLVEYGEDYTDAATIVENMQTVYRVGKGMLRDLTEDEDAEPADKDEAAAERAAEDIAEDAVEPAEPGPPTALETADAASPASQELDPDEFDAGPTRRRMAFRFGN